MAKDNKERNEMIFKMRNTKGKDGKRKTLQEIGDTFNLTRERIRQILVDSKLDKKEGIE